MIAVFPAEDYNSAAADSEKNFGKKYTALQLATGQAIQVSVRMAMSQNNMILRAQGNQCEAGSASTTLLKHNVLK